MQTDDNSFSDEQPEGNYLFWAVLGTALVVALGSMAMLSKLHERPELAAVDPLLVTVLNIARIVATAGLALLAGLLILQYLKRPKN